MFGGRGAMLRAGFRLTELRVRFHPKRVLKLLVGLDPY
jgi:hypothetical protein